MKQDIIIIGAGPAGLAFARSLVDTGLKVTMIERSPLEQLKAPAFDGRDIALTNLSVNLLQGLGIWSRIQNSDISPIKQARVLDGASPYFLDFDSTEDDIEALGYLVSNNVIRKALYDEVSTIENVEIVANVSVTGLETNSTRASVRLSNGQTMESSLVVAADSRFSETRRMMGIAASMHDFGRTVTVCRMSHEKPHQNIAHECFNYGRTLAVLPLSGNQSSIVITAPADVTEQLLQLPDEQFNIDIQQRFENRLGKMELTSERHPYPLVAVHARKFVTTRYALIGDAAVGMHPVTAHGYNLGLRGQHQLANDIKQAIKQGDDIGGSQVLNHYQTKHTRITRPLYHGTNGIVNLFTNDAMPAKLVRKAVLRLSNNFKPVKYLIKQTLTETKLTQKTPLGL
jgi:ubiquinone biosynthesis UbiH/UbiF/VisC/COQ6 family hydroxylase